MKTSGDPIILEAKRIILTEQLDKLSNLAISNTMEIKQPLQQNTIDNFQNSTISYQQFPNNTNLESAYHNEIFLQAFAKNKIKQTFFYRWKRFVKHQQFSKENNIKSAEQQKKIEKFIENLKKYKKQSAQYKQNDENHAENDGKHAKKVSTSLKEINRVGLKSRSSSYDFDNFSESRKSQLTTEIKPRNVKTAQPEKYKNRYEAQKNIIEMQKLKLEEQEKLIEALKLGKVKQDLNKSMENAKNHIRDIFQSSSSQVKCKVTPVLSVGCKEKELELELHSQKVPKIVQEMEKRAQERAIRREAILERKRNIDEQKRRIKAEAIEAKRAQDEDEKRRNLEAMKERRRKELELEKKRQMNKQKWELLFRLAETHYTRRLKKRCFVEWVYLVIEVHLNEEKCDRIYVTTLLSKTFTAWKRHLEAIEDKKNSKSDKFYNKKLLKRIFDVWKEEVHLSRQSMQVAEDIFDMRLESKIFKHWYRYVCKQYILEIKNIEKAHLHYNRRILFLCFHQWKSLPAVLQLEKAKEEKRKKWRERVWEILPDYQPQIDV